MIAKRIIECLRGSPFVSATFGSKVGEEDLLVYSPSDSFTPIAPTVKDFLCRTDNLRVIDKDILIIKHDHRAFAPPHRNICHLLFYPTKIHLTVLELPSFIASVWAQGVFSKSKTELEHMSLNYLSNSPQPLIFDVVIYQLARYDDIALTALFYALTDESVLPLKVIAENLSYAFRFMSSECLLRNVQRPQMHRTTWEQIIEGLREMECVSKHTMDFLIAAEKHSYSPNSQEIVDMGREYLLFRDNWMQTILGSNGCTR
jgi:hypothetical protein